MAASGKNPAARIKSLTLKRAKALGSLSFDMLSRMRTLTSLNLALCYGLDDDGLVLLGSQLPHLYTLNVRRCHKVSKGISPALILHLQLAANQSRQDLFSLQHLWLHSLTCLQPTPVRSRTWGYRLWRHEHGA